ncbi:DUF4332 domain-containing protein [Phormidium yuhuli AB48]|uniref:DUF4332 domain-containing protein n=1 Tax=Phormidium yuhuli AB48 TaxID=2940671 RepID=A0ABY5ALJ0_9CYAN|nr:DUF4332 domain-containing protein [Phormidium yuhuli]USR89806.1 DUF4332 domain-containing protein [Phormidium yuhuli AB48]
MVRTRSTDSRSSGNWAIAKLPGLKPAECDRLKDCGIQTTYQLLNQTRKPQGVEELAARLKISVHYVKKWAVLADLARIPGVGCCYCGLVLHCGVVSPKQLGQTQIQQFYPQLMRLCVSATRQRSGCPSRGDVVSWIQAAQCVKPLN